MEKKIRIYILPADIVESNFPDDAERLKLYGIVIDVKGISSFEQMKEDFINMKEEDEDLFGSSEY